MNTKQIITAMAIAFCRRQAAFASEVTEFKDTPSTLSRAYGEGRTGARPSGRRTPTCH